MQYVHRCGRAGRKQSRSDDVSPPTVFSFFTREFSAMAPAVIELLKACNAWVDPNLLALTEDETSSDKKQTNNDSKKRKRKHNGADSEGGADNGDESDNDQFAFLGQSVLKRASHVSDAEDSEDEDSS
jgi:superfamily II DNA/RNA helicase